MHLYTKTCSKVDCHVPYFQPQYSYIYILNMYALSVACHIYSRNSGPIDNRFHSSSPLVFPKKENYNPQTPINKEQGNQMGKCCCSEDEESGSNLKGILMLIVLFLLFMLMCFPQQKRRAVCVRYCCQQKHQF